MVGEKIKVIRAINDTDQGELPEDMIGEIYTVSKIHEDGLWVNHCGEDTLLIKGEYEFVDAKFKTVDDLIKWINNAPVEEVTNFLESYGFMFSE